MKKPSQKELIERLGEVPLFATSSKADRRIIARHLEIIDVDADTDIAVQDTRGDAFFVILEGSAVVRRNGRKIATLAAGDFFGELALIDPGPRNATVAATEPTTLGALHARMFNVILRDARTLRHSLLEGLAARVRELDRKLVG